MTAGQVTDIPGVAVEEMLTEVGAAVPVTVRSLLLAVESAWLLCADTRNVYVTPPYSMQFWQVTVNELVSKYIPLAPDVGMVPVIEEVTSVVGVQLEVEHMSTRK